MAPYTVSGFSDEHRYLAIAGGRYDAGNSIWSKDLVLRDCVEVAATFYARAQPTAKRNQFLDACDRQAKSIARNMPTYARAWLVQASIAAEQGRYGELRAALARATATAPNVHWLAQQRSELAGTYLSELDAGGVVAFEEDLRTLLDSQSGTQVLAYRFVHLPELRERLTRIVEGSPQELQQRFLSLVKEQTAGASP